MTNKNLIIFGASVRAAAESARRAGFFPVGCDLFADLDLREIAEAHRIEDYPEGILSLMGDLPETPWIYTGAWENHADLVARISMGRKLLGNDARVLHNVRDPFRVQKVLEDARMMHPRVRRISDPPLDQSNWLLKPVCTGGGLGISHWPVGEQKERLGGSLALPDRHKNFTENIVFDDDTHFFQEFIEGESHSAVYFATQDRCWLWGVTRQMVGVKELGAQPFSYCGSFGPTDLPDEVVRILQKIGDLFTTSFELRGIFGVDFILRDNQAIPIEINPRFPASAEVLEIATENSGIARHVACFDESCETNFREENISSKSFASKAILFAPHRLQVPDLWKMRTIVGSERVFSLADIPEKNTEIEAGHPICTVLARGENPADCLKILSDKVTEMQKVLEIETGSALIDSIWGKQNLSLS